MGGVHGYERPQGLVPVSCVPYAEFMCVGSVAPISLSITFCTIGRLRNGPMTGRLRKMDRTMGKKLLREEGEQPVRVEPSERTLHATLTSPHLQLAPHPHPNRLNIPNISMSMPITGQPAESKHRGGARRAAERQQRAAVTRQGSTHRSVVAHSPTSTSTMPPRKQAVPRHFVRREKNTSVLRAPISRVMPERNSNCRRRVHSANESACVSELVS